MAQIVHERGKLREYSAQISFGLNFEDNRQSVKVTSGDTVLFDGENAVYTKRDTEYAGKAPSLKSAISSDWLLPLNVEEGVSESPEQAAASASLRQQYDDKKGGNFNEFIAKEQKSQVIRENDQVVKNLQAKTTVQDQGDGRHEVAGDQVAVKENLVVGSSTTVARTSTHSTNVSEADHYGADRTIPLKGQQKTASQQNTEKARKTFTVDSSTPRLSEDATKDEVARATTKLVEAETQEAQVVRKIKETPQVRTSEGVTLRKTEGKKEMTVDTRVGATGDMTIKTQVGSGSTPVEDIQEVQISEEEQKAADERKKAAAKAAEERAAQRKAAIAKASGEEVKETPSEEAPAAEVKEEAPAAEVKEEAPAAEVKEEAPKPAKKKATKKKSSKKKITVKTVQNEDGSPDYLAMMPDDWSQLHWVKKEKFILGLEDADFVEFILRVETVNAVQSACKKRLEELGQKAD